MSWARLDDNFHDHRKVVGLDVAAVGLYTLGLTWAHRNARHGGQQGIVPAGVAQRFAGAKTKRLAAALVTAGLWHEVDGGWRIHDFVKYLPTAKTSEERAAAGRKGAAKRWARTPVDHAQDDGNLPSISYDDDGKPMATDMANDGSRADARREVLRTSLPTPVPEPVPSLTGELVLTAAGTAQTLIAEWVRACNPKPLDRVRGHVARLLKEMLDEDVPYDDVRAGLIAWHDRRLNPSTLPSVVHELRQGPRRAPTNQQAEIDAWGDRAMQRARARSQESA